MHHIVDCDVSNEQAFEGKNYTEGGHSLPAIMPSPDADISEV